MRLGGHDQAHGALLISFLLIIQGFLLMLGNRTTVLYVRRPPALDTLI